MERTFATTTKQQLALLRTGHSFQWGQSKEDIQMDKDMKDAQNHY